jgi:uncharacterized membrane protein (UPF0182 family)
MTLIVTSLKMPRKAAGNEGPKGSEKENQEKLQLVLEEVTKSLDDSNLFTFEIDVNWCTTTWTHSDTFPYSNRSLDETNVRKLVKAFESEGVRSSLPENYIKVVITAADVTAV